MSPGQNTDVRTASNSPNHSSSSCNKDDSSSSDDGQTVARGGVVTPFPWKVHDMLETAEVDGIERVVSWLPHGRAFMVHHPQKFVEQVMPIWFSQTKFASFQRQLNLYGFRRMTTGRDKGAYFNQHFLRGERQLIQKMTRQKIKGTKVRRAVVPGMDPDFWNTPFMGKAEGENVVRRNRKAVVDYTDHTTSIDIPDDTPSRSGPPTPTLSFEEIPEESDQEVLYFEGKPFHYLDRVIITDNLHRHGSAEFVEPSFSHAM